MSWHLISSESLMQFNMLYRLSPSPFERPVPEINFAPNSAVCVCTREAWLMRIVAVVAWCGWVYETMDGIFNHHLAAKQKFTGQEDCKLSKYWTNGKLSTIWNSLPG